MAASSHSAAHDRVVAGAMQRIPPTSTTWLIGRAVETALRALLAYWHLLSLDAPTVAALWVAFIARAAHIALPWTASAAMFLAVWVLYAADRILDSRHSQKPHATLEARHHFHAAHTPAFLTGIAVAAPTLLLLLRDIPPVAIRLYLLLGALLLAWLLLIHLPPAPARLPKELAVGIFFPAAIFIPTVARAPWLRPVLLPEAVLFAAVCSLNGLYIFAWEHPVSAAASHWTTRLAVRRLHLITAATMTASLLAAVFFAFFAQTATWHLAAPPAVACAFSAALLLTLNARRARLSSLHLRAAADLCLLTPLLVLSVLR